MDKRRFIVYVQGLDDVIPEHIFKFGEGIDAHTKQEAIDLARKKSEGLIRYELARYGIQYADVKWDAEEFREAG